MARILIVEDDGSLRRALADRLRFWGHGVDEAHDVRTGIDAVKTGGQDVVLLDLSLPDGSGLEVLAALRASEGESDVVVLTAQGSIEAAVEAIRAGASDFLAKPAEFELLRAVIDRILERRRLASHHRALARSEADAADDMVATSPRILPLLDVAARAAPSKATILITGESGTGKQKLAEYVHRKSDRAAAPFVYVNCVALNDELIESTLFGHEKGAFTGAVARKEGRLEDAAGGTVFLDEIGDVSPRLQAKLLHFLESGEFERVGGRRTLHVDCRVVAATNRDLAGRIREGAFREDLYWRLNVIRLEVPALRERPEDVAPLARAFVERFARELKRPTPRLDAETIARLEAHAWPGNVRELKNAIERMVVLAPGDLLLPSLLPREVRGDEPGVSGSPPVSGSGASPPPLDLRAAVEEFRRGHIARALALAGGSRTRAAGLLGVQRTHLSLLVRQYGLAGPTEGTDGDTDSA